ncbi:cyclic AMP-dependent transcription factor ATF-1-like [Panonychus citri]|uniref:cyclic AMP-dependent transcription factor ATF-1-like n=1 Tax=Panonychus citri TaxID=50023 RepID=UPI002308342E|nr:cyclic AMP-dependent transcription factor ATF-1-like [Panonychus citri]
MEPSNQDFSSYYLNLNKIPIGQSTLMSRFTETTSSAPILPQQQHHQQSSSSSSSSRQQQQPQLSSVTPPIQQSPSTCTGGSTSTNVNSKKRKRGKKSTRVDLNAKLERSRQSARECRARKKLRYQYLEDLVNKREKAVFSLRKELDTYKDWCKQVDDGANPKEALVALHLDKQTDFLKPT